MMVLGTEGDGKGGADRVMVDGIKFEFNDFCGKTYGVKPVGQS